MPFTATSWLLPLMAACAAAQSGLTLTQFTNGAFGGNGSANVVHTLNFTMILSN